MTLEDSLKRAAYKIWDELEPIAPNPKYHIHEIREEGLTSMALKELVRAQCPAIENIEMIGATKEKVAGYDFELAIGSKTQGKYVRMFIQGKTLKGKRISSSYKEIDFSQTEKLISYSRDKSSLGMYGFYNHLQESSLTLANHYNSATPFDMKSLGITIAAAYSIKMLQTKEFSKYHDNNGSRISPRLYALRHFTHLFYFHKHSNRHLSVPFHELSYFTIDFAEQINQMFRIFQSRNKTNFFFFFFPGLEKFFEGDDLIPIMTTNSDYLVEDFYKRNESKAKNDFYNPQALIIIDTDEIEDDSEE
ncbi:MAG: hypothetical protein Q7T12_06910 [Flavobacterium sp.]|nr:hypothetical protein [Flavobacterium sp.]